MPRPGSIYSPETARNPRLSPEQKRFETWGRRHKLDMRRNFYVSYHSAPFTYKELFGNIMAHDYYSDDKTQGAWDGWRARGRQTDLSSLLVRP